MSPNAVADLDPLLAPLAAPLRRAADSLLELREAARSGSTPGRCIRCYFQLLAVDSRDVQTRITQLRVWLENHIEAEACDADGHLLEVLPVRLDADDLETCCRGIMREMHEDRAYDTPNIQMSFRYKTLARELVAA